MIKSLRFSNILLRLGLAAVFLWFGIDKFIHPQYWLDAWVPQSVLNILGYLHLSGRDFITLNGIFEVLVGISLVSNIFVGFFSAASIVFLISVMAFHGLNEIVVRDIGLMGGFGSLLFWPEKRRFL